MTSSVSKVNMADILNKFLKILMLFIVVVNWSSAINIYSAEENAVSPNEEGDAAFKLDGDTAQAIDAGSKSILVRTERSAGVCTDDTCKNGGKCLPLKNGGILCACPPGFNGDFCADQMKPCKQLKCFQYIDCMTLGPNKGYVCICFKRQYSFCTVNYHKPTQETSDPCRAKRCGPGRCSVMTPRKAICLCPLGASGEDCGQPIRSLLEAPKSDCMMTDQGHVCICPVGPGRIPYLCKRQLILTKAEDPCIPDPCKNGGICRQNSRSYRNDYQCACPIGYRGRTCLEVMGSCATMGCQKIKECVSSPAGGICNCMGMASGRLCKLELGDATSWDKLKTVVVEEDLYILEAVLGSIVGIITLILICLAIHCKRVSKRRFEIREVYQELLRKGKSPRTLPPDWLAISSDLCKQTFCCASSKLDLDFKAKKSSSHRMSSHDIAQEEKEEALMNLLNSNSDLRKSSRHRGSHHSQNRSRNASTADDRMGNVGERYKHLYKQDSLRKHGSLNTQMGARVVFEAKEKLPKRPALKAPLNVMRTVSKQNSGKVLKAKSCLKKIVKTPKAYQLVSGSDFDEERTLVYERQFPNQYSVLNKNVNTNTDSTDEDEWPVSSSSRKQVGYPYEPMSSPHARYNVCRNNMNPESYHLEYENGGYLENMDRMYNPDTVTYINPDASRESSDYCSFLEGNCHGHDDINSLEKMRFGQKMSYFESPGNVEQTVEQKAASLQMSTHKSSQPCKGLEYGTGPPTQSYDVLSLTVDVPIEDDEMSNVRSTESSDFQPMKSRREHLDNQYYSNVASESQPRKAEEYGVWSLTVELPANEVVDVPDMVEKTDIFPDVQPTERSEYYKKEDFPEGIIKCWTGSAYEVSRTEPALMQAGMDEHQRMSGKHTACVKGAGQEVGLDASDDFEHVRCFEDDGRRLYYVCDTREDEASPFIKRVAADETGNYMKRRSNTNSGFFPESYNCSGNNNAEGGDGSSSGIVSAETATIQATERMEKGTDVVATTTGQGEEDGQVTEMSVSASLNRSFTSGSTSDSSQTLVTTDQSWMSSESLTDNTLVPEREDIGSDSDDLWL